MSGIYEKMQLILIIYQFMNTVVIVRILIYLFQRKYIEIRNQISFKLDKTAKNFLQNKLPCETTKSRITFKRKKFQRLMKVSSNIFYNIDIFTQNNTLSFLVKIFFIVYFDIMNYPSFPMLFIMAFIRSQYYKLKPFRLKYQLQNKNKIMGASQTLPIRTFCTQIDFLTANFSIKEKVINIKVYEVSEKDFYDLTYDAYYESVTLPQNIYNLFHSVDELFTYLKSYKQQMHIQNDCLCFTKDEQPLFLPLANDHKKIINNIQNSIEAHHHIKPLDQSLWNTLPYKAVVKIISHFSNRISYGSGVIVGKKNVLTVAHNLCERQQEQKLQNVEIFAWEGKQFIRLQVKEWKFPQQYKTSNNISIHSFDFANITLQNAVSEDRILQIQKSWNSNSKNFMQIGFSRNLDLQFKTKKDSIFYLRCQRFVEIHHSYATYDFLTDNQISGGPLLVENQGKFKVIGLHQAMQGTWSKVVLIAQLIKNPVKILEQLSLFDEINDQKKKKVIIKRNVLEDKDQNDMSLQIKKYSKAVQYNDKGAKLYQNGKPNQALQCFLKSLEIKKKYLGENHPSYAISLNNIGQVYRSKGDSDNALDYHLKSLEIEKKSHGENHPSYATSLNNIGLIYDSRGELDKALKCHLKSLQIYKNSVGQNHSSYATSLNNIGLVYDSKGDLDKALDYHFKALQIRKKLLGESHPDYATSLNNIGSVYRIKEELDIAMEYFQKSLEIRKKYLGQNHPSYATSLKNIGFVYYSKGDLNKALEYHQKALGIYKKVYGQSHPSYKQIEIKTKIEKQKIQKKFKSRKQKQEQKCESQINTYKQMNIQ